MSRLPLLLIVVALLASCERKAPPPTATATSSARSSGGSVPTCTAANASATAAASGGAHPNHGYDSLLYDKQAGVRLVPLALFASAAAFDAVIQQPFCLALDRERGKRRGEPVMRDEGAFSDCIKPSEQTVILGSTNGRTFDKVGVLVGPYAAGAYAEGDYEFTLPVTAALLKAVKPEYREEFSSR